MWNYRNKIKLLILLQIVFLVYLSLSEAIEQVNGFHWGLIPLIYSFIFGTPLAIWGIIWVIRAYKKTGGEALLVVALLVSIVTIFPISAIITNAAAPLFHSVARPIAKAQHERASKNYENERARAKIENYKALQEIFQKPQKVIQTGKGRFVLEGNIVIYLYGVSDQWIYDNESIQSINSLLLNQTLDIKLPTEEDFNENFESNSYMNTSMENESRYSNPEDVPVLARLNGELVNLKVKTADFAKLEKYK